MLRPVADPRDMALAVTMLVNAGLALPFALRLILPALRDSHATQGRLAASLGLHGGGTVAAGDTAAPAPPAGLWPPG